MIAYHFDQRKSLYKNQILNLLPNEKTEGFHQIELIGLHGTSQRGAELCKNFDLSMNGALLSFQDVNTPQVEKHFESMRSEFFSGMTSRLQCLFAVKDIQDYLQWTEIFKLNEDSWVWKVECEADNIIELDSRFWFGNSMSGNIDDLHKITENAFFYWNGTKTDKTLPELLLPFPVKVIERVDISNLFI